MITTDVVGNSTLLFFNDLATSQKQIKLETI
jgi:hypothetical protein